MTELDCRIPVTDRTRSDLRALKTGSERYEDVVRRLIDRSEQGND